MPVTALSIRAAATLLADNVIDTPCLYSRTLLEILVVPAGGGGRPSRAARLSAAFPRQMRGERVPFAATISVIP